MSPINKFFNHSSSGILTGTAILALAAFGSRVLGFLRNALLASTYGASEVLDAYFLAFRLPDLVFNILFFGALSAGFVPVFIKLKERYEPEAWKLANDIFNMALLAFTGFGVLFFIAAPVVVRLLAPGFDAETTELAVTMSRIMFLQPIFLGISGIFSGVLQSVRKFLSYSLAPIFYNVGIIIGIVLLVPLMGPTGLAWGVVLGAVLHFLIQYPATRGTGWRWRPVLNPGLATFKRVLSIMVPRSLSLIVHQINLVVLISFATIIGTGAVAIFNFANDLYGAALGILVVPLAVAAFPAFVRASEKDHQEFGRLVYQVVRQLLFLLTPLTVLALVLRAQIVRLALGYGRFGWEETIVTIDTFSLLVLGLVFHGTLLMILRAYFALEDAKTPLIVLIGGMAVTIGAALYLRGTWGVPGLALAMALGNGFNALVLFGILMRRIHGTYVGALARNALLFAGGAALAGVAAWSVLYVTADLLVPTAKVWGLVIQGGLAAAAGSVVYVLIMYGAGVDEVREVWVRIRGWRLPRAVHIEETPDEELPR